jgi:predicted ATPase
MRIAISGAANTGKSTLLKSFLYTWKQYKTPDKTYRDIIMDKGLEHSSKTTPENQTTILDSLIDQQKSYGKLSDKVVHDRCALDALAYTLWCNEKGVDGFTAEFVQEQITKVKDSMKNLDMIFVCKFDNKQAIDDDGSREADLEYIQEIDNIYESLFQQYYQNVHADVFFPKDDSPAVIKLPDTAQERIDLIAEYVTPDGEMYGEESSILNPENIGELEQLVQQQQLVKQAEEADKELFKKFDMGNSKYDLKG